VSVLAPGYYDIVKNQQLRPWMNEVFVLAHLVKVRRLSIGLKLGVIPKPIPSADQKLSAMIDVRNVQRKILAGLLISDFHGT
jgi:hypothetical protein